MGKDSQEKPVCPWVHQLHICTQKATKGLQTKFAQPSDLAMLRTKHYERKVEGLQH